MKRNTLMVWAFIFSLIVSVNVISELVILPANGCLFAKEKTVEINVRAGDTYAGNGMGSFDTVYRGKKIRVDMYWDEVKVYKNNIAIEDVTAPFFPFDSDISQKGPISGKEVRVTGVWVDAKSFKAAKVFFK